ncbi:hypothetical protein [Herbiconiux daphne]|uniref:Abi family protein n=1 Tax=Herbiconiux daphne TaxID=2970914 RepID=A0ABT2H4T0_9MICO|nr:hypothetical protein [Herbiconiux daphne]MCS5734949.1 hypothetical protein [Herbiconiux daphne]
MDRLRANIPEARMQRYDAACRFDPDVDGIELYRWASAVALAVFDDLAHVEVAMRSAMARELASSYGLVWYRDRTILDQQATHLVEEAMSRTRLGSLPDDPQVVHGKLVASLTFGFWVKLLGRGQYAEVDGERQRRIYDTVIWKAAVRRAFPQVNDLDRQRVEGVARRVQALRNRIAHHEHIVWGVPIAGGSTADGEPLRLPLMTAHASIIELAGFLNKDLESWLREHSQISDRIEQCPIYAGELMLTDEET